MHEARRRQQRVSKASFFEKPALELCGVQGKECEHRGCEGRVMNLTKAPLRSMQVRTTFRAAWDGMDGCSRWDGWMQSMGWDGWVQSMGWMGAVDGMDGCMWEECQSKGRQ
eukprot:217990-Chlamydomonas_euryale.AAC.1